MRSAILILALIAASLPSSESTACSAQDATVFFQAPQDNTRIGSRDRLAVHLTGEFHGPDPTPVILDSAGNVFDRTFSSESHYGDVFSNVFFFGVRPALPPGRYEFFVRYHVGYPGSGMDVDGPRSRFEVTSWFERPRVSMQTSWDLVNFDDLTGTSCGIYLQLIFLTVETAPLADEPVWFLVDVEGHAREGVETQATESSQIITTRTTGFEAPTPIRIAVTFEADCVTVTPVSLGGPVGDAVRSCQPSRCLSLIAEETDPFEEIDLSAAQPCELKPVPNGGLAIDRDRGCACSGAEGGATWLSLLMLLALVGLLIKRA